MRARHPKLNRTTLAMASLLASMASTPASAASCTWNTIGGNWNALANWLTCATGNGNPGGVPGAADTATIGATGVVTINTGQSVLNLNNAGQITIDAFGLNLVGGGSTTNSGVIHVGGASTANLGVSAGHNINNTGGVINVGAGSVINQFGSTITGGTINTTGSGALVAFSSNSNILSNVTLNGTLDLASIANARQRIINGATINGAVNIGNGGILRLDSSAGAANQTIGGAATFNMNDASAAIAIEGTGITTLGAGVNVRGQGTLGGPVGLAGGNNTLVNNGVISADVSGGTLNLVPPANGGSVVNNNLLRATGGGTLLLSTQINNAAGQISAGNGSVVIQNGVGVTGGVINTSGTGSFQATSNTSNVLDGVTVNGLLDLSTIANARARIINGATLNGAVNVGNGGILSLDSNSTPGGAQSIGGTGVINLNDAAARLTVEGNGSTALGANLTVRGQGLLGGGAILAGGNNVLTNNGLVSADVAGGTLNIVSPANGGSFVNNGTLQAVGGGTLLLSTNITANPSGQLIAGAGSSVVQNGVRINGTINASGTGVFTAISSTANVLDGVNFNGTLDLASIANARERIVNGATINGVVNISNGGILSLDSNGGAANQSLAGTVVINMNDAAARLTVEGSGSTTLGTGVTLRGQGLIGGPAILVGGNNVLTNNGLVSADVAGGTLNIVSPANGGSFVNNGTLQAVGGGTLLLSTNITANPSGQLIAGAGSSVVQNGVRINGTVNASGTGVFTAVSSTSNVLDAVNFNGTLDLASIANARERIVNGATINGVVNISNGGILSLDSNGGAANQSLTGTVVINMNDAAARLTVEGSGSTTLGSGVTVRGQGSLGGQAILVGGNNVLTNNGLVSADVSGGTLNIVSPANGGSFVNNGTLQAVSGGRLLLSTNITSNPSGQIFAGTGSSVVQNGVTLTGTINSSGSGLFSAISSTSNVLDGVNFNGTLDLTSIANARERIINGATLNGVVNIGNGGILSLDSNSTAGGAQTIGGNVAINMNDAAARLTIEGAGSTTLGSGVTVRGQGSIGGPAVLVGGNNTLFNNGTLLADVSGGTLTIVAPANGGTLAGNGTLQTSGGAMNLATGAPSTQGRLTMGGAGSSLNLNSQNLTITNDYTNAQSGSGNSFNRRAGVTGTGQIVAGGDVSQVVTGAAVTGGTTNNATLTVGNMRVGANTFNVQIGNAGTTGPTLRGAIQTNVNGGNITDTRLSGAGVTASNYNAGAPGGNSGNLGVTFTAASAGALAPLTNQVVNLRSNFDNIADQKLNIVLAGGAAAFNAAVGNTTPTPVTLANQRVGGTLTQALTVNNTAAAGGFSEDLRATFGTSTGAAATNGGSVNALVAGGSNASAMNVSVNTATSGAKSGSVTINYDTTGTVGGVSNGLGVAGANPAQVINVSGNVYQTAAGQLISAPLNFGTVQVGQTVTQNLVVRNTATGAAGFVEDLHASFGAASGTGAGLISGSGSLNGILAGTNSTAGNGVMTVAVNTGAAGVVNGSIAVNYTTAGAVGGVSNGLGTASVGTEAYGVQGQINAVANVINQASPLINTPTINLGAVRVGAAAPSGTVSVSNVATAAPQAALNASIAATSGPITASGSFALLNPGGTNSSSLVVGLNTGTAGNFTGANAGTATISLVSDAGNVGGCGSNCQLNLASQVVNVEGKVYTAAVGSASDTSINFGVVRVGDTVSARNITVNNTAASTALNDTLRADVSGLSGPISGNGSVSGIGAQSSGLLAVGLNTANAGIFSQNGSIGFTSQNADMADVSAGASAGLSVFAQVNNLANGDFDLDAGTGTLSQTGTSYVLDLGTIVLGNSVSSSLSFDNEVAGPADALSGSFDLTGADDFALSGWNPLAFLGAGQAGGTMTVNWLAGGLGLFTDTIVFNGVGTNASDPLGLAQTRQLIIRANVVQGGGGGNVPEPGTLALLLGAAAAAAASRRRIAARNGGVQ